MFLLRCKCGCFFTLKDLDKHKRITCQECGNNFFLDDDSSFSENLLNIHHAEVTAEFLPESAKITVTYDL